MGVETILLVAASAASAGAAVKNAQEAKKARKEQQKLVKEREAELANETIARRRAAESAATRGSRAGRGTLLPGTAATGMGAPQPVAPIATRGTLFGN